MEKRKIILGLPAPTAKKERTLPQRCPSASAAAAAVSKFSDLSCCCDYIVAAEKSLRKLELRGCAVVSKGILVVEGQSRCVKSYLKFMHQSKVDYGAELIWQGRVSRRSLFGKFSILRHCTSDFAVSKFFADHGASHYWDMAVESNSRIGHS